MTREGNLYLAEALEFAQGAKAPEEAARQANLAETCGKPALARRWRRIQFEVSYNNLCCHKSAA
jgi:hypothetical protein